jgi:ligand-binding SRPBCC domain-containing protein
MPIIRLQTRIGAPPERVFDLARSIDLHAASMTRHGETAVAGVMHGLIGPNQEVTWRAKHLGVWQRLVSRVTAFDRPRYFRDSMVRGAFRRFDHDHHFEPIPGGTLLTDTFDYTSPLGPFGRLADALFLQNYMTRLLAERNHVLKAVAESESWRRYLAEGD